MVTLITLNHRRPFALETASAHELDFLLDCARALQRARQSGAAHQQGLLRGKRIGLLSDAAELEECALFQEAATELGAHVAHVRPGLSMESSEHRIRRTARMLDRLYDAVGCVGMPTAVVQAMRDNAAIPIFNGLASAAHPIATLADQLDDALDSRERHRLIVQAALMQSIG